MWNEEISNLCWFNRNVPPISKLQSSLKANKTSPKNSKANKKCPDINLNQVCLKNNDFPSTTNRLW